ncbi:hypothetical protein D5E69_14165 [Rossellomorea marisflavi]|nr:hypothetical protein D5E69_14165 [Rossellomorea marisflavi]
MVWISENKEWLFSGIGIVAITSLLGFVFKSKRSPGQKIDAGNHSNNVQGGKNVTVTFGETKHDK